VESSIRTWAHIEAGAIEVGDLVSAEAGGLPVYCVIALKDGRLWLREEPSGRNRIAPPEAVHWKLAR
jgi:hypothetical protein